MFCKYINESTIKACPQNGYVGGKAISNLPRYFENNPDIARAEGYKPLKLSNKPEIDNDKQYITAKYEDTDNAIIQHWVLNDIEQPNTDVNARIAEIEAKLQNLKEEVQGNDITS